MSGLDVPKAEAENGACVVCLEMVKKLGIRKEITIELEKRVPIGLGMGSSGASAAAAAVAMNQLLGLGLCEDELIYYAGKGEAVTSGSPHYDNVSASILGGFVVVRGGAGERPTAVRFAPPAGLAVCVATPTVNLPARKTEYARSLLPRSVSPGDARLERGEREPDGLRLCEARHQAHRQGDDRQGGGAGEEVDDPWI